MAARKNTGRKKAPTPAKCSACEGKGEVPVTVRVGRKRRVVGQQSGICLACMGSGLASSE
ncbi:hypothetical protein [Streptomyces litchfieldiae]|uniref:Molecular chaperone DnaJ n=1 Tax=Streptomyces litchfieldiae TaxID=3075543 RepID=A0ABU2N0R0_9ACTN|nr:hypothetical protein [Streptomyces sp. DSM 44938]MDT0347486.1 hypothetical protein [Streptomyces sp. DSM 44938]